MIVGRTLPQCNGYNLSICKQREEGNQRGSNFSQRADGHLDFSEALLSLCKNETDEERTKECCLTLLVLLI